MDTFLRKMQKSSAIAEVRSIDTLQQDTLYKILKFVQATTKYGVTVQAYLELAGKEGDTETGGDDDGAGENECIIVYLPNRIGAEMTEEEINNYNDRQSPTLHLSYHGRVGRTFDVRFS